MIKHMSKSPQNLFISIACLLSKPSLKRQVFSCQEKEEQEESSLNVLLKQEKAFSC